MISLSNCLCDCEGHWLADVFLCQVSSSTFSINPATLNVSFSQLIDKLQQHGQLLRLRLTTGFSQHCLCDTCLGLRYLKFPYYIRFICIALPKLKFRQDYRWTLMQQLVSIKQNQRDEEQLQWLIFIDCFRLKGLKVVLW